MKKHYINLSLILFIWFIMSFYNLDKRDLWSAGETRDAQVAHEMLESKDFLIPQFNGVFIAWKPPLFHWTECLFSVMTGGNVNSLSSRLPSTFSFLIGALAIYFLLMGIISNKARVLACLIFLTSYKFAWMSRVAQIDVLFSVLIGIAFLIFFRLYYFYDKLHPRSRFYFLMAFYVFSALSVLAKGPAGAVVIGGGVFFFLLLDKNLRIIPKFLNPWCILVFVLIGGSWYIAITIVKGKEFFYEFFINQNFNRFVDAFDHKKPFFYFFSQFIGGFMPWTFFFFVTGLTYISNKKTRNTLTRFCLCCFAFIFLFFSLSTSKRGVYILPLYLPAAIATAVYLSGVIEGKQSFTLFRFASWVMAAFFMILGSLLFVFQNDLLQKKIYDIIEHRLSHFDRIMYPKIQSIIQGNGPAIIFIVVIMAILGLLILFYVKRKSVIGVIGSTAAGMLILNLFFIIIIIPFFNSPRSMRPFSEKVIQTLEKDQPVYVYGIAPEDLIYYSKKKIIPVDPLENVKQLSKSKNTDLFLFTDTEYVAELSRLKISHTVLFDTGIKHIDGVLVRIKR